ncbi:MAG: hypothetical protein AMJ92_05290 [candidate division Zixibacteria bacterium SM23_81]|nr:MAG: hypothetical protein AMJ92_05290 [candidate division Zixibacteria bacterium SM23_81]
MKSVFLLLSALILLSSMPVLASQPFQVSGLVRTISLYENYLQEQGKFDTQTLSLYALYSWRCGPEFLTELTMDINADAPDDLYTDYYMELQLIKPIGKGFSVRIKDVEGTYMDRIVRFGVGYDF